LPERKGRGRVSGQQESGGHKTSLCWVEYRDALEMDYLKGRVLGKEFDIVSRM